MSESLLPGATLGILGGGQLGRMFTIAARTMGYRVIVLDPDPLSPAGQFADLAVLSADYFTVPEKEIKGIEAVLTIMGGKIVHGSGAFAPLAPSLPPVSPDWSPVASYGGYRRGSAAAGLHRQGCACHSHRPVWSPKEGRFWGIGCDCFAF